MAIIYRPLHRNESNIYRTIRLESLKQFPEFFSADYEETSKIEKLSMEHSIENETPDRFVFGAFNDGELFGISSFVKDKNGAGTIYQMYVQKKYQGKKQGFNLLIKLLQEAKERFGELAVSLQVSRKNASAINLYKKAGFSMDESSEGKDSLVMMKRTI